MYIAASRNLPRGGELGALLIVLLLLLFILHIAHATGLRNSLGALTTLWAIAILLRARERPPLALPIIAWLGIGVASSLWSLDAGTTLKSTLADIAMPTGAFYAAFLASRQQQAFSVLSVAAASGTVILAALTVAAFAMDSMASLQAEGTAGVLYYYPGPGVASTLAVYAVPFALQLVVGGERIRRRLGLLSLACAIVAGAATLNRMFWPALFATLVAFGLWHWRRLTPAVRMWILGALVACGLASVGIVTYLNAIRDAPSNSFTARLQAFREWSAAAAEYPLLGQGFGRKIVPQMAGHSLSSAMAEDRYWRSHGHNLFLNVVLQVGITGLMVFLLLLGCLAKRAYTARHSGDFSSGGALVALVVAMLIKNLTDDFMTQAVVLLFWSYAGILVGRLSTATGHH
jgi:O-antigen ligase